MPPEREAAADLGGRLLERWVAAVVRRPGLATAVGLTAMAVAIGSATRVELADDARAFVAEADPEIGRQLEVLSEFTTIDNLLLHLDSQGHPDELTAAARAAAASLRQSGLFRDVRYETDPLAQLELVETLMPRRFLLDPRPPAAVFEGRALAAALDRARAELLAPQGVLGKSHLVRDPLGSLGAALVGLSAAPGLSELDAATGRFLSRDGGSLLVVTVPAGNPFSAHDAERTMAAVAAASAAVTAVAPHVRVRPLGAHRFARDAERLVRRDIHVNAAASIAVILAVFFAFFRRLRLVLVSLPPLAFGTAVAFGLAGALGKPVHGIVLAFAASSLGLAIDYTIHLIAAAASEGMDTRAALPRAARKVGRSLILAVSTTLAGLLALTLSQVPALRAMGVLAFGAVLGSFAGALLWVPVLLPHLAPHTPVPPLLGGPWAWMAAASLRRPRLVASLALAAGLGLTAVALGTRVDGDLRNLDTHTPEATADEAAFARAFGDTASAGLAVVEGASLEEALERAAAVDGELEALGITRRLSLTRIAPPPSVAAARRAAWCGAARAEELARAGVAAGFRSAAFAAFAADLADLCAPAGAALRDPRPAIAAFEKLIGRPLVRTSADGTVRLAVAFEANEGSIARARAALRGVGATVVHRAALNASLVRLVVTDLPRLFLVALGLVLALLLAAYRRLGPPLAALAPCALALVTTLAVLAAAGIPLNIMNLAVFPLVFGSGIDYGIVMADAGPAPGPALRERAFSVTVAAITTLAGFGTLATARYYAIATIGQALLLGIGASAFYAVIVTPALRALGRSRPARLGRTPPKPRPGAGG